MQLNSQQTMDANELDNLHRQIIEILRDGRATPSYLAELTGESRQLVSQRLRDLMMGDVVEKVHTGLYELNEEAVPDELKSESER